LDSNGWQQQRQMRITKFIIAGGKQLLMPDSCLPQVLAVACGVHGHVVCARVYETPPLHFLLAAGRLC